MRPTLIVGGLEAALALLTPAMRLLRIRPKARISDREYFAAARKRAIQYRLRQQRLKQAAADAGAARSSGGR